MAFINDKHSVPSARHRWKRPVQHKVAGDTAQVFIHGQIQTGPFYVSVDAPHAGLFNVVSGLKAQKRPTSEHEPLTLKPYLYMLEQPYSPETSQILEVTQG